MNLRTVRESDVSHEVEGFFSAKASVSLKSREADLIRTWLMAVIDDLGLASLQSFPVQELSKGFPELIDSICGLLTGLDENRYDNDVLDDVAVKIATLRKDGPVLEKMLDDYSLLKQLLLEAATGDLRKSDLAAVGLSIKIDEGLFRLLKAGIEAFIQESFLQQEQVANTDALTGLFNIRYFRAQMHRNLEMYKRYRIPFALLMLDLDGLRELNGALGHTAGDSAIKHLAMVMNREKRETDVAVRYGGDEFFLLLPGTSAGGAERLAGRISRKVREINLRTSGSEITGVSIGVVSCPTDGTDVGALRAKADRAMYLAKSLGGASFTRYQDFAPI